MLSSVDTQNLLKAYEDNGMTNEGKMLVLFLFNNAQEMRLLRMHPDVWQMDTTHGTNSEKKELFTIAATDGNKKAFTVCRAYIPNAQAWVFATLFNDCLPIFLGNQILSRNKLIMTDGATNEYVPLILSTGEGNAFPNTCHGLCYFHIAIQGWNTHVQPHITKEMNDVVIVKNHVQTIRHWVKSWFFTTETESEYIYSKQLFYMFLSSLKLVIAVNFVNIVTAWVKTKLDPYRSMWLNHLRLHVQGFDNRTTSTGESMHHSIKNGYDGVKGNEAPHTSATKMMDKSKRKCQLTEKYNAKALNSKRTMKNSVRGD